MQRITPLLMALFFASLALGTRSGFEIPQIIARYGGDYLWGVMLYFLICALLPRYRGVKNLCIALFVSYSVETMQIYQADWIMAIRANKWGGLLLGHGFLWSDILLYTLGNISGFGLWYALLTIRPKR